MSHVLYRTICVYVYLHVYRQWTISTDLPATSSATWMTQFSNVCLSFIAIAILECYVSGYLRSKKGPVPWHCKYIVKLSLFHKYAFIYFKSVNQKQGQGPVSAAAAAAAAAAGTATASSDNPSLDPDPSPGIEMHRIYESNATSEESASERYLIDVNAKGEEIFDWLRLSRALDRISRVCLPIIFSLVVLIGFNEFIKY